MFNSKAHFESHSLQDRQSNLEKVRNKALSMLDPATQAAIRACDGVRENNHRMCYDEGGGVETGTNPINQAAPQVNQQQSNSQNTGGGVGNYLSTTAMNNQSPSQSPPQNLMSGTQSNQILPNSIQPKY